MSQPGYLIPWVEMRFGLLSLNGYEPNANGFVEFRQTDLSTPLDTWDSSALDVPNPNPIQLDPDGRPPSPIYFGVTQAYSVFVYAAGEGSSLFADAVLKYSIPYVADYPSIALASAANTATLGTTTPDAGPYLVLADDNLVVVPASAGGSGFYVVQLLAAATRGTVLYVKNMSLIPVRVTPDGSETCDLAATYYTIPAAAGGVNPTVALYSDAVSNWWVLGGIGI